MSKTILITGGAGYIGSHAVKLLLKSGNKVIILDNLVNGYQEAVDILKQFGDLEFVKADLQNRNEVDKVFNTYDIDSVIHFAALCSVNESMEQPELYFQNNVNGSLNLFEAMRSANVKTIVFSSTCAVYGEVSKLPVSENHPLNPTNPYGESKLLTEKMLCWYGKLHGFKYAILRYFNVCGADKDGVIGDSKKPSSLLMQNAVRGALNIEKFYYTCPKVDTPDGSPIRDYIDVEDLVKAHEKALEYLESGGKSDIFNLGVGAGYSVKEIVGMVEKILNVKMNPEKGEERKGEYAKIYADPKKAMTVLNWKTEKNLEDSVESLVKWYKNYPNGYTT